MGKKYRIVSIRRGRKQQRPGVWLLKKIFGPMVGGIIAFLMPLILCFMLIVMIIIIGVGGGGSEEREENLGSGRGYTTNISAYTRLFADALERECNLQGISEYYQVLLAMMDMESGGESPEEWPDRMCASECGLYTPENPYDDERGAIKDPYVSIQIGVRYFKQKVNNYALLSETGRVIDDYNVLCAIVQSYNFGDDFIFWLEDHHYMQFSLEAAQEYSDYMADKLGWSGYGDPEYIRKFEERYNYYSASGGYAGDLVEIALSQVGNVGGDPYWSWYGFNFHVDWCACFVSWCAGQCGYIDAGCVPMFSGCGLGSNWFINRDAWANKSYTPSAGDIIFFDWEPDGAPDHVGIVTSVRDGRVYTVEGNTGASPGTCTENAYPVGYSLIYGYGLPNQVQTSP